MDKIKKTVIFLLSLIITSIPFFESQISAKNSSNPSVDNVQSFNNKLFKENDWKYLSKIWKKLNSADEKTTPQKELIDIVNSKKDVEKALLNLRTSKLLCTLNYDLLLKLFSKRMLELQFRSGLITCYEVSEYNVKLEKAESDIELRYDILEKLSKEGKIGSSAYKSAKEAILQDYKIFAQEYKDKSYEKFSGNLVDLLYYLGK